MTLARAVATEERNPRVGLFTLDPRKATPDEASFSIALDAGEPYLDDHQPGGAPLFSTVMAIEAAVTGARCLAPGVTRASVTGVHVHKPYILGAKRPHIIDLHVLRSPQDGGGFHCTLSSMLDGQRVPHLHAVVQFRAPPPPAGHAHSAAIAKSIEPSRVEFSLPGPVVKAAKVYELFFHGPSFQVIGEAQYHAGQMLCRLQQKLPPSHRRGGASETAPRLIEFALQSAGLLEVATNGRMKIPDFIGSIERYLPVDVDATMPLFAIASYGSDDAAYINVDIVDASGNLVLGVDEYRTAVLPFAFSGDTISALHAQFLCQ